MAIANSINDIFTSVADDLDPLDLTSLPAYLPSPEPCSSVYVWEVYKQLRKIKSRKAGGPDGIPTSLIHEFAYELCKPLTNILNSSYQEGLVPNQWKKAIVIPLPKSFPPSWNNLRPVSLTDHFAKISEHFIVQWITSDIHINLDPNQFGSRKGVSTAHYLVKLIDNLCSHAELSKSHSSLVVTDFSKAFDHIDHNILVKDLIRLGTRPSIIPWICSFLSERSQCVRYKNLLSNFKILNGGVPQGTKFGPLGFLAKFNDALSPCNDMVNNNGRVLCLKYVDDMTIVQNHFNNERTIIQDSLDVFGDWSQQNNMNINSSKCANMNVCFMKNVPQYEPLLIMGSALEVVDYVKILGIWISSNLKWDKHIDHIYRKANSKIYMLKLLKKFNLSLPDLLTVYKGYIRPLTEYATQAWNAGLTKAQNDKLESIQKRTLKIILGKDYGDYHSSLSKCNIVSLKNRRKDLCLKFTTSLQNSDLFGDWLPQQRHTTVQYQLRHANKLTQIKCNTNRFKNSPIPYFVNILNGN